MNDVGSIDDIAAAMIIIGITIFLAIVGYFVYEVIAMWCGARRSQTMRIDPIIAAWPCDVVSPRQSWVGEEIEEEAMPPRYIFEAEQVAARRWDLWEMSPIAEEDSDD